MNQSHRQNPLLVGFFVISLLLHLLVIYLLPQQSLFPAKPKSEPVYVEVRPPQSTSKPLPRELDIPPRPEPEKPRETPAKRLGPQDQIVEQETAPEGQDFEDMRPAPLAQPPAQPKPQTQVKAQPKPKTSPKAIEQPVPQSPATSQAPSRQEQTTEPEAAVPPPKTFPDLKTLTQLAPQTVARLEDQWRQKYRKDVARGNAVWLDTEKDILISFFKRFRDGVYNVWNYPPRSAERGEEGTCLLKITIKRDGSVEKVQLMESSGFGALDEEAIEAVKKAGPYGNLPRSYTENELNIFAFFRYNLSRRIIY